MTNDARFDFLNRFSPNLHREGCRYQQAVNDVEDFRTEDLNAVSAAVTDEISETILDRSFAVLTDSEKYREHMNQRVDRLLIVVGVFAGLAVGRLGGDITPLQWIVLACFAIAIIACLWARYPFASVSPAEPLAILRTVRKCADREDGPRMANLLMTMQMHRAVAANRQVNDWVTKLVLTASIAISLGIILAFASIAFP